MHDGHSSSAYNAMEYITCLQMLIIFLSFELQGKYKPRGYVQSHYFST